MESKWWESLRGSRQVKRRGKDGGRKKRGETDEVEKTYVVVLSSHIQRHLCLSVLVMNEHVVLKE